jgi:hypothetical protein
VAFVLVAAVMAVALALLTAQLPEDTMPQGSTGTSGPAQ